MRIYLPGSARGFIRSHCLQSLFERGHKEAEGVGSCDAILYATGRSRPQDFIDGTVPEKALYAQFIDLLSLNSDLKRPFLLLSSTDVLVNNNPYTALKLSQEAMLRAYARCYDFKMLIVRSSCVFGPGMGEERFIPQAAKKILNSEPVTVHIDRDGQPSYRAWTWAPALADELVRYIETGNWVHHSEDTPNVYYNWKLDAKEMARSVGIALDRHVLYTPVDFYRDNPGHFSGHEQEARVGGAPHPANVEMLVALRRTLYSLGYL